MHPKLRSAPLQRDAYIYLRQSTSHQVRAHPESGRRPYALADPARVLGFAHVTILDEDVGRSGAGHHQRPGFGPLLAAGGAVFALEASRVARHHRDWHQLSDVCALTATWLMADDGVSDPRQLHDGLVLGRKGAMAEAEPGLMRQRARHAFAAQSERGHVMWEGPVRPSCRGPR